MTEQANRGNLRPSPRAKWTLIALSVGALVLAIVLTVVPLVITVSRAFDQLITLGLLQPMVAAFLALTIILGIRIVGGRYVGERRKGGTSASSAAIAVRLWALCFSLLAGSMLLFAALQRPPQWLEPAHGDRKKVETVVEVNGAAGSAATRIKVAQ